MPALAGLGVAVVGLVNVLSALTPNIPARAQLLLSLEPVSALPIFHALALPAGVLLIVVARSLGRRRRRAWQAAVGLLAVIAALDLLKGLDVEEAALSVAACGLLVWSRGAFYVRHDRNGLRAARGALGFVVAGAFATAGAVWAAAVPADPGFGDVVRGTLATFAGVPGPIAFRDGTALLPLLLAAVAIATAAAIVLRPLRSAPPSSVAARRDARRVVLEYGSDTLAYFKLRADAQHFFSADGAAFVAYRIESGVLLVSGDPVGPRDALPGLLRELAAFAEVRDLRLGAVGASEGALALWRALGLRALRIGDEAMIDTVGFSVEGRRIRKVRQSVARLERSGFSVDVARVSELPESALAELELVSDRWLRGSAERGFSMALDSLRAGDTTVVVARDGAGAVRAFLHFVPSADDSTLSLSAMRRDPATPNGLTEYLIVRAIEMLRGQGVTTLSLNFAAFARVLHSPRGALERLLRRVLTVGDRFFQIERLYSFNEKFGPRWEPRYLVYESSRAFVRTGLATLWTEGQLPRLRLVRRDPHTL